MTNIILIFIFTIFVVVQTQDDKTFNFILEHIRPDLNKKKVVQQEKSIEELIARVLPDRAQQFEITIEPPRSTTEKEYFHVQRRINNTVLIIANSGVAAATGFHYYLKYYCNSHISWEGEQLSIPKQLPYAYVTLRLQDKFRYYQNVCTTSYSFVWWSWREWEKHIDWMAMNGFNLVLASNGQEAIWERIYLKLGMTTAEISAHMSGPGFLSWLRMGNMRAFGGPLSPSWHMRSLDLQKRIVGRMRELGIITVLPAFAGHVPIAFKRLFPKAKMAQMTPWNNFNSTNCCPYFVDPTDPLFNQVGTMYLEELTREFGTDHVYNCDSFNENEPPNSSTKYLSDVGKSIFKAMTDVDPNAVWLMQGWMFYSDDFWKDIERAKALITSVPLGRMIVLDLQSEQFPQYDRLEQYFGQPWIWCMLHNFGGTLGMFGSSSIVNEEPIKARNATDSTMIGVGMTPEGINQNYVMYDLMAEQTLHNFSVNLYLWFGNYATRRYGNQTDEMTNAWRILQRTVYDYQSKDKMRGKYAITTTPSLKIKIKLWYKLSDLKKCWKYFQDAGKLLYDRPLFKHDMVDVTRQILQVYGDYYYMQIVDAFTEKDLNKLSYNADIFMDVLHDLEQILATNEAFLLGRWLESAKNCGQTAADKKLFEYNARNQITLWGPKGEIMNYANKQWSGVVSHFFAPRWALFISYLKDCLKHETKFNQTYIKDLMFKEVEEPFTLDRSKFPTLPVGDTIDVAGKIYNRWELSHRKIKTEEYKREPKKEPEERIIVARVSG